jgi:hypothetical protein
MNYDENHRWPNWPEFLRRRESVEFIGYGTLINKVSASRSMSGASERKPVNAFGVRRVFNFVLEDKNYADHGGLYRRSEFENHVATLNIQETGKSEDIVNGVLMQVSNNDVDGLAEREAGYDIISVVYSLVESPQTVSRAYIFTARQGSSDIGHRVRNDVLPNESSLETCLSGARDYGEEFLDTWIRHCYLADGSRLLANDYYRTLVEKITDWESGV